MRLNFAEYLAAVPEAWMMAFTTVVFLTIFIGWTLWVWAPANKERLDEAALLPLDGDD